MYTFFCGGYQLTASIVLFHYAITWIFDIVPPMDSSLPKIQANEALLSSPTKKDSNKPSHFVIPQFATKPNKEYSHISTHPITIVTSYYDQGLVPTLLSPFPTPHANRARTREPQKKKMEKKGTARNTRLPTTKIGYPIGFHHVNRE